MSHNTDNFDLPKAFINAPQDYEVDVCVVKVVRLDRKLGMHGYGLSDNIHEPGVKTYFLAGIRTPHKHGAVYWLTDGPRRLWTVSKVIGDIYIWMPTVGNEYFIMPNRESSINLPECEAVQKAIELFVKEQDG